MNLVENELTRERKRLAWLMVCRIALPALVITALAQGFLVWENQPRPENIHLLLTLWAMIVAAAVLSVLAASWRGWRCWSQSKYDAGRLVDDLLAGSKNRLEAAAILKMDEPIAQAQREETARYLASAPFRRRRRWTLLLLGAASAVVVLLNVALSTDVVVLAEMPAAAVKPTAPPPQPYAQIDITSPESDQRLKPIEEVVVKGNADTDSGFKTVSLVASVNGNAPKTIPIDPTAFSKGGQVIFKKSLLLDELEVEPFDIVSYHVEGVSNDEKPLHVSSQIQFIEVRPFKEDIFKGLGGSGSKKAFDKLVWCIEQELILSKRSWLLSTSNLPARDPYLVDETKRHGDQQNKVSMKTHELYNDMVQLGLPAVMVEDVSKAESTMHDALDQIHKPDLASANPLEQHALGELVEATKLFVKIAAVNASPGGPSGPKQDDPFRDKQKKPNSPGDSPFQQIADLIKKEQSVVSQVSNDMGKSSSDDTTDESPKNSDQQSNRNEASSAKPPQKTDLNKTAQDQKEVSKGLDKLQSYPLVPANSMNDLSEAEQAANDSADKLQGNQEAAALSQARTAEAAMLRAQKDMEDAVSGKLRSSLAKAQEQLEEAAQKLNGVPDSGQMGLGPRPRPQKQQSGNPSTAQSEGQGDKSQQQQQNGNPSTAQSESQGDKSQQQQQSGNPSTAQSEGQGDKSQQQQQSGNPSTAQSESQGDKSQQQQQSGSPSTAQSESQGDKSQQQDGKDGHSSTAQQDQHDRTAPTAREQGNKADEGDIQQMADNARDTLAHAQEDQAQTGDPALAKLAGDLMKQYDDSGVSAEIHRLEEEGNKSPQARAAAARALMNLADQLQTARLGMQSDEANLKETIGRVDHVLQNMNVNKGTAEEQREMAQELKQDLDTAGSDARKLLPAGSKGGSSPGEAPGPGSEAGSQSGSGSKPGEATPDSDSGTDAPKFIDPLHGMIPPTRPIDFLPIREQLMAFRDELEQRLNVLRNQTTLSYLNPDESPEEYRAQVAAYYERISRETHAATPTHTPSSNSP